MSKIDPYLAELMWSVRFHEKMADWHAMKATRQREKVTLWMDDLRQNDARPMTGDLLPELESSKSGTASSAGNAAAVT